MFKSNSEWVTGAPLNEWTLMVDGKPVGGVVRPAGCDGWIAWTRSDTNGLFTTADHARVWVEGEAVKSLVFS